MAETQESKVRKLKYKPVSEIDAGESFPVHLVCKACNTKLSLLKRSDGTYYFCAECVNVTSKVDDNTRGVNP